LKRNLMLSTIQNWSISRPNALPRFTVPLFGGLGNQLFGLAFAAYLTLSQPNAVQTMLMRQSKGNETHGQNVQTAFNADVEIFQVTEKFSDLVTLTYLRFARSKGCIAPRLGNYFYLNSSGELEILANKPLHGKSIFVSNYFRTKQYLDWLQERSKFLQLTPTLTSSRFGYFSTMVQSKDVFVVHVRRGDYMRPSIGEALPPSFFLRALSSLGASKKSPLVLLSDSPDLVKREFTELGFDNIVNNPDAKNHLTAAESLAIASKSHNFVMSNSTFSWWAARTGNLQKRVAFPSGWNTELMSPNWTSITT